MGPVLKKSLKRERVKEEKMEKKQVQGRERQKRFRANLMKRDKMDSPPNTRASSSAEPIGDQETPDLPLDVEVKEEYDSEDADELPSQGYPKSEVLPGPKDQTLYYDGVGFYYTQIYEDVKCRWLQCYHGDCKVMARMARHDGAAIHLVDKSVDHQHPPNPARRDRLLFLHSIRTRHADEDTPFSTIFKEEAAKNPVGASFFPIDKIQAHLQKKISLSSSENLSQERVQSAASQLSKITMRPTPDKGEGPAAKRRRLNQYQSDQSSNKKVTNVKDKFEAVSVISTKASERMAGPHPHSYLYKDGNGVVYKPLAISGNTRYLACNTRGCNAKAKMTLEENAPIIMEKNSPAHNHFGAEAQASKEVLKSPAIRPTKISVTDDKLLQTMKSAAVVLNRAPSSRQKPVKKKRYERIEGPEYFYDHRGHYYFSTKIENDVRILRCLFPTCLAQAMLALDDDAEIKPINGSRPHNHRPDFSTNYREKMKEWEDQWLADSLPSERLPSLRVQYCCYHDGKGYYYHQTSQADNIRYLACVEPKCPVKACMNTQKEAPITISGLRMGHNHRPDYMLRETLLFLDAVRVRARSDKSISSAISIEAGRNPVGAERVNLIALKNCLEQCAKLSQSKNKDMAEDEVDFVSCLKIDKNLPLKPSTESQIPVANHFGSAICSLDDPVNKDEKGNRCKAEMVPALFSDSWLYHDGCGYYYNTKNIKNGLRYMQCVIPKCGVQAMVHVEGGPVKTQKPHSHGPQPPQHSKELWFLHRIKVQAQKNPDLPVLKIYKEVAEKFPEAAAVVSQPEVMQLMNKFLITILRTNPNDDDKGSYSLPRTPVEVLPTSSGDFLYHDGRGFFYTLFDTSGRKSALNRLLKCSYHTTCPASATLVDGYVEMNKNSYHNHKPNTIHRDICLFSQALKKRTRDEETPLSVIYREEAQRYPKAAAVLQEDRLKSKLSSIRKYVRREINVGAEDDDVDEIQNSANQSSTSVKSEIIPGKTKDVYHDGKGYYYYETFTEDQIRYLMCCEPHCLAQAKTGLVAGAPIVGASLHCHPPDLRRRQCLLLVHNFRQKANLKNLKPEIIYAGETAKEPIVAAQIPKIYLYSVIKSVRFPEIKDQDTQTAQDSNEDDELWSFAEPCERLPSEHGWLYFDGKGYLYYSHDTDSTGHRRQLKCCEEDCDSTATLDDKQWLSRAPGSVLHNHLPDRRRRSMLMLLHRVAVRAQTEQSSVRDIFNSEAHRDPRSAELIPRNKLNETLQVLTVRKYFKDLEEEELDQKEETSEKKFMFDGVSECICEELTSASSNQQIYHDNKGYYFIKLSTPLDRRYVRCLMPLCTARGFILPNDPDKLHIPQVWAEHNHKSDLCFRNKLLFISNLRKRTLAENTSIEVIYEEESEKEPVGADQVDDIFIKTFMHKLRKSKIVGGDLQLFPFEDFPDDCPQQRATSIPEQIPGPSTPVGNDHREAINKKTPCQNKVVEIFKKTPRQNRFVVQKKIFVNVKKEDNDSDEYTEEEYLEEEKLEEIITLQPSEQLVRACMETESEDDNRKAPMKNQGALHPAEMLYSRTNSIWYYNGEGYYYQVNNTKENNMYVKCTEPKCMARGLIQLDKDDAPIIPSATMHNHEPDYAKRDLLVFIQRCKERAARELHLTVRHILESELERDDKVDIKYADKKRIEAQIKRYRIAFISETPMMEEESQSIAEDCTSFKDMTARDDSISDPVKEIELHVGSVPEKVPSLVGDSLWHADGYYYSPLTTNVTPEEVKCVEKVCKARAVVTLGDRGQPLSIRLSEGTLHNHGPDVERKDQLIFIDRCKRRAATTLQSVEEIYYDEAAKAPEVAAQLSGVRVKRAMAVAKKEKLKKGIKLESKDHGMSELGEMAKLSQTSTTSTPNVESQEPHSDGGVSEHDTQDDLYAPDTSYSSEDNSKKKKAVKERQQRFKKKIPDNKIKLGPQKKELILQKIKEATINSEPKSSPKLGPKFVKQLVEPVDEEESYVEEETLDDTYSDYVTLEEELEYNDMEENIAEEEETGEENIADSTQSQDTNKIEQPSHLVHGRLMNSFCYHDGKGFYYDTPSVTGGLRLMKCVIEGCPAKGCMQAGDDAPINLAPHSPAHTHPADPLHEQQLRFIQKCETRALNSDDPLENIYEELAEEDPETSSKLVKENLLYKMKRVRDNSKPQKRTSKPKGMKSEELPGFRPNSTIFHDLKGYYYLLNNLRDNKRYMRCIVRSCKVRGIMQSHKGAPIRTGSHVKHSHGPDLQHRNFILFLHRCKERATNEEIPVMQIYRDECKKDPMSAAQIPSHNLYKRMNRLRRLAQISRLTDQDQTDFVEACLSNTSATDSQPHELKQEDASECFSEADSEDNELVEEKPEELLLPSEALPARRPNTTMYHDGRGYYFIYNNHGENVWYMRCVEPHCKVRATMKAVEGSPIVQTSNTVHNHRPDYKRKQFNLWMTQAKNRAATELHKTIPEIYKEEAARDPQSSSMIRPSNMRARLHRARRANAADLEGLLAEGGDAYEVPNTEETTVTDAEEEQEVNKFDTQVKTEESQDGNTVYQTDTVDEKPVYFDDKGFSYHQTTVRNNLRYLKCVEAECKARASMGLNEDSVIHLSKQASHHNHPVVLEQESQLAMLLEPSHIPVIFTDEIGREQVAMCHIVNETVEQPKRPYKQRTKSQLTIDPEDLPLDTSALSEVDEAAGDYYHNEDQQKFPLKPSEVIPGLRPDANNYHDGNGFYYELNRHSPNIRYLKCVNKDCKARAYMELHKENAPIIQTNYASHNHGPDLSRKRFTVFLHRVTRRAAEEDTPINTIYQQEADRDPVSASQIRMKNVKLRMTRYRNKHRQNKTTNADDSTVAETDMDQSDISVYRYFTENQKPELKMEEKDNEMEDGEEELYESYVVNEVEVESQQNS
ncbi:uncharacterized protein LOC129002151 isoform X3 [Macrosteles quadrilineatus]|uniref:uncharacterized protein LOC129002151 isoform X3 n=1 Tax=Macrosteles quadrilineatus TaxID=74068 RepID=UPI0023E14D20|nr:uncharacterized protein LOC129002151 isoform X3 [Macrosteles quadrilineatus]